MGSIVLTRRDGKDHVIDGQQRLATTSLLLVCVRDELRSHGADDFADHVERQYLIRFNPSSRKLEPRLNLAASDAAFYMDRFIERNGGEAVSSSQRRLSEAFEILRRKISTSGLGTSDLMALVETLTNEVMVVLVEAATEADAFQIFETLNDRGAPLTLADLLKNYLVSRQPHEDNGIAKSWDIIAENLGAESEAQDVVTYIRHYWSSVVGATRERDLYKSLRSSIKTPAEAVDFSKNLEASSEKYAALLDPNHELWAGYPIASRAVRTLLQLQLGQYRPLLLAAFDKFEPDELERLAGALVSWSVRGLIVGGAGGGTSERAFAAAGVSIRNGKTINTSEVFNQLRPIIPTDDDFHSSFASASVPRAKVALYLVHALNEKAKNAPYPNLEGDPSDAAKSLALVHVLPRKADPVLWNGFATDDMQSYLNRLGNLTLIDNKRPFSNTAWETRRSALLESGIPINDGFVGIDNWSPEKVRQRQLKMADVAVLTWPRAGR